MEIHPVTPDRWRDMVELFERRGVRGGRRNTPAYGCWCMYWRDRSLAHGEPKKRAMAKLVRDGREPGLLAYDDGMPVGWIAIAPRRDYTAILRSPQYRLYRNAGFEHVRDANKRAIVRFELLHAGLEARLRQQ